MKRRSKHAAQALVATALLLGILLIVNLISTQLFTRIDLTEGKIYTLSKASRELVRGLDDKLTAKAYFTQDLPAPYNSNARYLRDMLEDYRAYSGGKFAFEFVDPGSDSLLERQAQEFSIPPRQMNVVDKDKIELKKVYMGLVFMYADKHETMPIVENTDGLEYEISSTIKRLTAQSELKVGFLRGYGAPDVFREMSNLNQIVERNYQVNAIELARNQMVPEDITVLLVIGLRESLDDWAKYAIDQYIMKGGKVAFLLNKVSADLQNSQANPAPLNLDDWLEHYGVKINNDLLMDARCGMINVRQQMGYFTISNAVNYPFFPQINTFNGSHPMVKDLENLMLFFPSTIDTSAARSKGLDVTPLFYSSKKAKVQRGRFDIRPMQPIDPQSLTEGPLVLGAALEGVFQSYYAHREIPRGDTTVPVASSPTPDLESPRTRLVVIGDGHIAEDAYMSDPSNVTFLLNMVDWLTLDENLIQIRTRAVTNRPLAEISDGMKATIKYANIFAPAVLVIVIGVVRWQMRRRRKYMELVS